MGCEPYIPGGRNWCYCTEHECTPNTDPKSSAYGYCPNGKNYNCVRAPCQAGGSTGGMVDHGPACRANPDKCWSFDTFEDCCQNCSCDEQSLAQAEIDMTSYWGAGLSSGLGTFGGCCFFQDPCPTAGCGEKMGKCKTCEEACGDWWRAAYGDCQIFNTENVTINGHLISCDIFNKYTFEQCAWYCPESSDLLPVGWENNVNPNLAKRSWAGSECGPDQVPGADCGNYEWTNGGELCRDLCLSTNDGYSGPIDPSTGLPIGTTIQIDPTTGLPIAGTSTPVVASASLSVGSLSSCVWTSQEECNENKGDCGCGTEECPSNSIIYYEENCCCSKSICKEDLIISTDECKVLIDWLGYEQCQCDCDDGSGTAGLVTFKLSDIGMNTATYNEETCHTEWVTRVKEDSCGAGGTIQIDPATGLPIGAGVGGVPPGMGGSGGTSAPPIDPATGLPIY